MQTVMVTFVQATFVLATFVHIKNISAITVPTKIFEPNFLGALNFFGLKFCMTQTFCGPKNFWPKFFWTQNFLNPKFFWPNNFWTEIFLTTFFGLTFLLSTNFFGPRFFWTKFFYQQCFGPKFFLTQIFLPKIIFTSKWSWTQNIFGPRIFLDPKYLFYIYKIYIEVTLKRTHVKSYISKQIYVWDQPSSWRLLQAV